MSKGMSNLYKYSVGWALGIVTGEWINYYRSGAFEFNDLVIFTVVTAAACIMLLVVNNRVLENEDK